VNNDKTCRLFQTDGASQLVLDHNTLLRVCTRDDQVLYEIGSGIPDFGFSNSIVQTGLGFTGVSTMSIVNNALIGASAAMYPASNFVPASVADVGFTDLANGDYRLTAASPFHGRGSDGADLGADAAGVQSNSARVLEGR
jgi:hypothetical protein